MAVLSFTKRVADSLMSLTSKMGGSDDKAASVFYTLPFSTEAEQIAAYRGAWLPRKIVTIPAFDAFRRWRSWQAEENIIELIEAEEKRLNVRKKLLQAMVMARLFGGAALYIGTGASNSMKPLDPSEVKKGGLKFLNIMRRRDLTPGEVINDPESEYYGQPEFYTLRTSAKAEVKIHVSRLVILKGAQIPDEDLVGDQRGWGDSVLTATMTAIKNADSTAANIASLVFEARVDVVRVPDLMASLDGSDADIGAYEGRLLSRFRLANAGKGINSILLLDKEEEYEQKSTNFTTLPDILMSFMQIVSGAADIPVTRLLGQSPAGLNATGESDIRNYYDHISSIQEVEIMPAIHLLDECLIMSALGSRPPEIWYEWTSLWQTTDKERVENGFVIAQTAEKLNATGLLPPEALANAVMNMLVENAVMPGIMEEVEEAGGLPDFEAMAEMETAMAEATLEATRTPAAANTNSKPKQAANDTRFNDMLPRSLYVSRAVLNAAEITRWAKAQGFTDIVDDLHVTVVYSKEPVDWHLLREDYGSDDKGNLTIKPGGPRTIEKFGDAIVLEFASNALVWRHGDAMSAGASHDFESYRPHITISKTDADLSNIKPYTGKIELGPEIFEEVDASV